MTQEGGIPVKKLLGDLFESLNPPQKATMMVLMLVRLALQSKAPLEIRMDLCRHALKVYKMENIITLADLIVENDETPIEQVAANFVGMALKAGEDINAARSQLQNVMLLIKDYGYEGDTKKPVPDSDTDAMLRAQFSAEGKGTG
jgi:hypothetical protein